MYDTQKEGWGGGEHTSLAPGNNIGVEPTLAPVNPESLWPADSGTVGAPSKREATPVGGSHEGRRQVTGGQGVRHKTTRRTHQHLLLTCSFTHTRVDKWIRRMPPMLQLATPGEASPSHSMQESSSGSTNKPAYKHFLHIQRSGRASRLGSNKARRLQHCTLCKLPPAHCNSSRILAPSPSRITVQVSAHASYNMAENNMHW